MIEIAYRFHQLVWPLKHQHRELAEYRLDKISQALELALERRRKRAVSARPFLDKAVPGTRQALESRDSVKAARGLEAFQSSCIQCHQVPYFGSLLSRPKSEGSPL